MAVMVLCVWWLFVVSLVLSSWSYYGSGGFVAVVLLVSW